MRTHVRMPSEPLVRGCPASEEWARSDPIVYVTEVRRAQARAVAEALGAARGGLHRGLSGFAALGRHLMDRLGRRSERQRAIARLTALDERLLADIGLRRGDIELAVDGLLADPRVTRRTPAQAAVVAERLREGERCPLPAATANTNRPAAPAQSNRVPDLAA